MAIRRALTVIRHVTQHTTGWRIAIDERTTRNRSDAAASRCANGWRRSSVGRERSAWVATYMRGRARLIPNVW